MTKQEKFYPEGQRLGEMGLENFAPYLMNRIIGRYNAALSSEMTKIGLTTPPNSVTGCLVFDRRNPNLRIGGLCKCSTINLNPGFRSAR